MKFCEIFSNSRVIFICAPLICANIKITWLNSVIIIPKTLAIFPKKKQIKRYTKTVQFVLSASELVRYCWSHYAIWQQVDVERERAFEKRYTILLLFLLVFCVLPPPPAMSSFFSLLFFYHLSLSNINYGFFFFSFLFFTLHQLELIMLRDMCYFQQYGISWYYH